VKMSAQNLFIHFFLFVTFSQCPVVLSCTGLHGVPSVPLPSVPGGGKSQGHCLHWDGKVQTSALSNETMKVHEVEVGDRVLAYTSERGFHLSPVVAVLHRDLAETLDFVRFTTSNGRETTLTTDHGVYSGTCGREDWKDKRADDLKLGDCVKTANGQEEAVIQIQMFSDVGAVQPITEAGSIVVDEIVLSCYDFKTEAEKESKAKATPHEELEPYRLLYTLGENVYKGLRESRLAINVLETLIRSTGLEKVYAA